RPEHGKALVSYLHLNPDSTMRYVNEGQVVSKGQRLGRISNYLPGATTTIHLHFSVKKYDQRFGKRVYIPPYSSLVKSYKQLLVEWK
ncbi:MAG: M23 family metallopeptidase, partial [Bacteroidota bacterium]